MKKIIAFIILAAMLFTVCSCTPIEVNPSDDTSANTQTSGDPYAKKVNIKIDVKDFGVMTLELYPDLAPATVENFLAYVDKGFFDGLTFHRIMKGFMIQGGDPAGNGTGGGDLPAIKGEFSENGFNNPLSHTYGVISMARTNDPNSATSQFFICNADASSLDGKYAAFGKLIDGADVLDAISDVEVTLNAYGSEKSVPVTPVIIKSITRAD